METELRLYAQSRDFKAKLERFAREQSVINPQDSITLRVVPSKHNQVEMALLGTQDGADLGRLTAVDLEYNTLLRVQISDLRAESWWKNLFRKMTMENWTDYAPPKIETPSESDDLLAHLLYAISLACKNQGWEMKYTQPISDDRTYCQIEAVLVVIVERERRYGDKVSIALDGRKPLEPLIWSDASHIGLAFADTLRSEISRAAREWYAKHPGTQQSMGAKAQAVAEQHLDAQQSEPPTVRAQATDATPAETQSPEVVPGRDIQNPTPKSVSKVKQLTTDQKIGLAMLIVAVLGLIVAILNAPFLQGAIQHFLYGATPTLTPMLPPPTATP